MTTPTEQSPSTTDGQCELTAAYVREIVDRCPRLTDGQRRHIAGLLRGRYYLHPTRKAIDGTENGTA